MYTLNKHLRWREEKDIILICDCKRLIDLKIDLEFSSALKKFETGVEKEFLNNKEKLLFKDLEKLKLLSILQVRPIKKFEFPDAMKIISSEIKNRVRNDDFLFKKFLKFPEFFIGSFLDNELFGAICGFPREDYLLISEIAVDYRFQKRGFGRKLVEAFEKIAKNKYKQINIGAQDDAIKFYESVNYKPFLLIQYKKGLYSGNDFRQLKILKENEDKEYKRLEVKEDIANINLINSLRKKYPKAHFQYVFTKKLD